MFDNWFEEHCPNPIDLDLGLIELRDDPDEHWTMRAIAGHSVGMDPHDGFHAVSELAQTIRWCVDGLPEGQMLLARILGAGGNDYQRSIYYALAGRDPLGTLADLGKLASVMDARLSVSQAAADAGRETIKQENPYRCFDGPDGPLGLFPPRYVMAAAWEGLAKPSDQSGSG